ncbi:MAG: M50 family metallopeptidase [Bacteroidia bacterium]|nr:M50 family metallopeptidase [Bacteroidia bacterium]MCZ2249408.1 M50 family metallopeptidase [Bacteroidia bacterium]
MFDCLTENYVYYGLVVLFSIIGLIPVIGKFVNVINTLIHESGHAFISLFSGGGVVQIKLSADTSGSASTKSKYWLGKVLTSLAGYPFSSAMAWLFFYLIAKQKAFVVVYILFSMILLNLILWVRNTFGVIWLIVVGILTGFVLWHNNVDVQYYFALSCASLVLSQSVYTSFVLVSIALQNPDKSGDAKNLRDFTSIPAILWAVLFLGFSLFMFLMTIRQMPCAANFLNKYISF